MVEDLLLKVLDYGIAGVALYLLFKIANNRLTDISVKLDVLSHKIDDLRDEIRRDRS